MPNLDTGNDQNAWQELPNASSFVIQRKHPLLASITYDANPLNVDYTYRGAYLDGDGDLSTSVDLPATQTQQPIVFYAALSVTTNAPHGEILFPGRCSDRPDLRFIWLDGFSAVSTIRLYGTTLLAAATFTLYTFKNSKVVEVFTTTQAPGVLNYSFAVPYSGYYAISYAQSAGAINSLEIDFIATETSYWKHEVIPAYDTLLPVFRAWMCTAASTLVSNTSAELARGGTMFAAQLERSTDWRDYVRPGVLAQVQGSVSLPARNGCYGFFRPGDKDFTYAQDIQYDPQDKPDSLTWPLNDRSDGTPYVVFEIQATDDPASRSFQVSQIWHLQFLTTSVAWPVVSGTTEVNVVIRAAEALAKMSQFSENPLHIKKMWGWVKKAANDAAPYVEKYGPILARMLKAL